ncbi:MAG TPA: thiamine phosphate synthase [Bryobacteraceae bacterium]|nr:thiamine phosphate synthase [Bryobacteraceae bacterium]
MRRRPDWNLYLVTDRLLAGGRPIEDVIAAAVRGGVSVVQLREKQAGTRQFVELGRKCLALLRALGIPLIINDRVDVALAVGADGVHIGQEDMEYAMARQLLGPEAIIGLSVETPGQAEEPEARAVDYLGVGPIFSTPTKPDAAAAWGLERLRELRARSGQVLVAIGGIGTANAAQVIEAGADGLAVVSAICAAPDPEQAARELCREIARGRAR